MEFPRNDRVEFALPRPTRKGIHFVSGPSVALGLRRAVVLMLKPALTSWRAQYERMMRSHARVIGPHDGSVAYDDDLHHFMQDCWHLKDWLKNDPLAGIGKSVELHVLSYASLRVVADLANGSKHLDRYKHHEGAYVTSTNVTVHLGQDRPTEHEYVVTLADGKVISAEAIVDEAVKDWNELLSKLGLI